MPARFLLLLSTLSFFIFAFTTARCPPPTNYCITLYDPVTCVLEETDEVCQYSNICFAQTAGFTKDKCILESVPIQTQSVCAEPTQEALDACTEFPTRNILCGPDRCPMVNVCVAKQMGWKKRQCVTQDGCRLELGPMKLLENPCPEIYAPVVCDENISCSYDSQCKASNYGYADDECIPFNIFRESLVKTTEFSCKPELPFNEKSFCGKIYKPVKCGGNDTCVYGNQCEAGNSGYSVEECVPVKMTQ